MGASGTDHRETITLGTPAVIKERDQPITPSPVISPLAVSQALNTTNSAFSFMLKISLEVNQPLSLPDGARAMAPGMSFTSDSSGISYSSKP